jgi:hypothetical protein
MKRALAHSGPSPLASPRGRPPAFSIQPLGEVPEPEGRMERTVRLGHRLQTFAGPSPAPAAEGEAVQRASSDEEESSSESESEESGSSLGFGSLFSDGSSSEESGESSSDEDEDYVERLPSGKTRKQDPGSAIREGTYEKTDTTLKYQTVGGAQHSEVYDPDNLKRVTTTTGLKMSDPGIRNNAFRKNPLFQVHNLYKLSPGQSGQNQSVVSHSSPSWAGMRAGGEYQNSSETSQSYNSRVEGVESGWRSELQNTQKPLSYTTKTHYERLADNLRAEEVAAQMTHEKWKDPKRIEKRLNAFLAKNPDAMRIVKEKRTLTGDIGGTKKQRTARFGPDLHLGIPSRAYRKEARTKYVDARGQESEASDLEIEEPKKKRKRALSDAGPEKKKKK